MAVEKRRKPRRHTVKRGKAVSLDYDWIVDCDIKDLSAAGARLMLNSEFELPLEFQVLLPEDQILVAVEMTWRSRKQVGVKFRERDTTKANSAPDGA